MDKGRRLHNQPTLTIEEEFHGDFQFYNAENHFYAGNTDYLIDLLNSDEELTMKTRSFIADVLSGKIVRKKGQHSTRPRDLEIFIQIWYLLEEGKTLRGKRKGGEASDGAADVIGDRFGIDSEAAIKAYYKIGKEDRTHQEENREKFLADMSKNPDLFNFILELPDRIRNGEFG